MSVAEGMQFYIKEQKKYFSPSFPQLYSEHIQPSEMELFAEIVDDF